MHWSFPSIWSSICLLSQGGELLLHVPFGQGQSGIRGNNFGLLKYCDSNNLIQSSFIRFLSDSGIAGSDFVMTALHSWRSFQSAIFYSSAVLSFRSFPHMAMCSFSGCSTSPFLSCPISPIPWPRFSCRIRPWRSTVVLAWDGWTWACCLLLISWASRSSGRWIRNSMPPPCSIEYFMEHYKTNS